MVRLSVRLYVYMKFRSKIFLDIFDLDCTMQGKYIFASQNILCTYFVTNVYCIYQYHKKQFIYYLYLEVICTSFQPDPIGSFRKSLQLPNQRRRKRNLNTELRGVGAVTSRKNKSRGG